VIEIIEQERIKPVYPAVEAAKKKEQIEDELDRLSTKYPQADLTEDETDYIKEELADRVEKGDFDPEKFEKEIKEEFGDKVGKSTDEIKLDKDIEEVRERVKNFKDDYGDDVVEIDVEKVIKNLESGEWTMEKLDDLEAGYKKENPTANKIKD
jgi:hypothetical protein